MAGVAVGNTLEVVLVLGLGLPERAGRRQFGHYFAGPQAGRIDVGDGLERHRLLLLISIVDGRAITRTEVVTLAIFGAGVVNLEE